MFDDATIERTAMIVAPDVRSMRHKQNRYYVQRGFEALYDEDHRSSIEGVSLIISTETHAFRVGVLEQLGRILVDTDSDIEYVRHLARQANDLLRDDSTMTVRRLERALRGIRKELREAAR